MQTNNMNLKPFLGFVVVLILAGCKPDIPVPVLLSLEPSSGSVGEPVFLLGENMENAVELYFDDVSFKPTFDTLDPSLIIFRVPENKALGSYDVYVTGVSGASNTLIFEVVPPSPVISLIEPGFGAPGDTIEIRGANFGDQSGLVRFSTFEVSSFLSWNDSAIQVVIPEGATSGEVVVEQEGRVSNAFSFTIFTQGQSPMIQGIFPDQAFVGDTILIVGENFIGTEVLIVFSLEKIGQILTSKEDSINVVVPQGAITGPVRVEVDQDPSPDTDFTVLVPTNQPEITSIMPGSAAGGDTVTISGNNFAGSSVEVIFPPGAIGNVISSDNTSISVRVPTVAISGNVLVEVDNLTSNPFPFTVTTTSAPAPQISVAIDSFGRGQDMIIQGQNIVGSQVQVSFEQGSTITPGLIIAATSSQISARVPQGLQSGLANVFITVDGNQSNKEGFTLVPPPRIDSYNPDPMLAGEEVTIVGDHFIGAGQTQISFFVGGVEIPVSPTQFNSPQEFLVPVPANLTLGTNLMKVVTPFGETLVNINVDVSISITQILPSANYPNGPLIIYGQSLNQAAELNIGGNVLFPPAFQYYPSCNCLATNLPGNLSSTPINIIVQTLGGGQSTPISYGVDLSQTLPPPGNQTNTFVPIPPSGPTSLPTFNNQWIVGNPVTGGLIETSRYFQNDGQNLGSVTEITDNSGVPLGFYSPSGDTVRLLYDGIEYFGKQDNSYPNSSVSSVILTPLISGSQIEFIFPLGIDQVQPATFQRGDTITVRGKYFLPDEFDPSGSPSELLFNGQSLSVNSNNLIYVSSTEIKIVTDTSIPTGNVNFAIRDFNTGSESNPILLNILP